MRGGVFLLLVILMASLLIGCTGVSTDKGIDNGGSAATGDGDGSGSDNTGISNGTSSDDTGINNGTGSSSGNWDSMVWDADKWQ